LRLTTIVFGGAKSKLPIVSSFCFGCIPQVEQSRSPKSTVKLGANISLEWEDRKVGEENILIWQSSISKMSLKVKILSGLVAALVVLVVLAIIAWPRKDDSPCGWLKNEPSLRGLQVTNMVSEDEQIVANMAGYVHFHEDNTYLPLKFSRVTHVPPRSQTNGVISFSGQCVSVVVTYSTTDISSRPGGLIRYHDLSMSIPNKQKTSDSGKLEEICKFQDNFSLEVDRSRRYSSRNTYHHECGSSKPDGEYSQVATLVLRSFEIEMPITDDKKKIKEGKFSSPPDVSSSTSWKA
jgi:hypothetical protein